MVSSDVYEPDFCSKEDVKDAYSGKTVRNWFWNHQNNYIDKVFDISRKNDKHLTLFDVVFDIKPKYQQERSEIFSNDNFSSAIDFLKEHNVYSKLDRGKTIYHIPVIGLFEKYDEKKNKYIYRTENEEEISYSFLDDIVVYEVWDFSESKFFPEKNLHKKLNRKDTKEFNRQKFGRKPYKKTCDSDNYE